MQSVTNITENNLLKFWDEYHRRKLQQGECLRETVRSLSGILFSQSNLKILEIGCGAGNNLTILSSFASVTYGCDVSRIALDCARQFTGGKIQLLHCPLSWIPLSDQSFDIIVLSKVLSTLADDGLHFSLVQSIQRLLRPSGRLLLMDYIYSQKLDGNYVSQRIGKTLANILSPSWSSIDFVHFNPDDLCRIFAPLRYVVGYEKEMLSCRGHSERGYVSVFQKK
jgi:SAM-dependent methyltransferase